MTPLEVMIFDRWRVEVFNEATSTNALARDRAPWTAVRALRQTAGRGRFERAWFSPPGGLWATLVLPHRTQGTNVQTAAFPLAVGHVLLLVLRRFGLCAARLRWPNDIMVGNQKLGGVLMELQPEQKLLVGIGINVVNPLPTDPPPDTPATRLADHLDPCPEPPQLLESILESATGLHACFFLNGFGPYMEAINAEIGEPRAAEIELLDGSRICGLFLGVDESANPVLRGMDGGFSIVPAHQIARFREV